MNISNSSDGKAVSILPHSFPTVLRAKISDEMKLSKPLGYARISADAVNYLKTDNMTREKFLAWAKANSRQVNSSPVLNKIVHELENLYDNSVLSRIARKISQIFRNLITTSKDNIVEFWLENPQKYQSKLKTWLNGDSVPERIALIKSSIESGMLSKEKCEELLKEHIEPAKLKEYKDLLPAEDFARILKHKISQSPDDKDFSIYADLLSQLPIAHVPQVLEARCQQGFGLIHAGMPIVSKVLAVLEKMPSNQVIDALLHKKNDGNEFPIQSSSVQNKVLDLLLNRPSFPPAPEDLGRLFKEHRGVRKLLEETEDWHAVFAQISPQDMAEVLRRHDDQGKPLALHKHLRPYLDRLTPQDLAKVLCTKSFGANHGFACAELLGNDVIKLLEKLPSKELVDVLFNAYNGRFYLIEGMQDKILELLLHRKEFPPVPEDLGRLFKGDEEARRLLENENATNWRKAFELLSPQDMADVFKMHDRHGHILALHKYFRPFLPSLPSKELAQVLLATKSGHLNSHFFELIHERPQLLEKLDSKELADVLLQRTASNGSPYIHSLSWTNRVYLIDKLDAENRGRVLISLSKQLPVSEYIAQYYSFILDSKTPSAAIIEFLKLSDPPGFPILQRIIDVPDMILPLLVRLSPQDIALVLKQTNKDGIGMLQQPAIFKRLFPFLKQLPAEIQNDVLNFSSSYELPMRNQVLVNNLGILSAEELSMFLQVKGAKGLTPLQQDFQACRPLLGRLSPQQLFDLGQRKDNAGRNLLLHLYNRNSYNRNFYDYEQCYYYFEARLPNKSFINLLLQRNNAGEFIFNESTKNYLLGLPVAELEAFLLLEVGGKNLLQNHFDQMKPLLDSLPRDRLFELVKKQDASGRNILLYNFSKADRNLSGSSCYEYLKDRLSFEQFNELLLMRDKEAQFPVTPDALAVLSNLSNEDLQAFLLVRGEHGGNIVETHFEEIRPLLNRLSKEQLLEIATKTALTDPICRAYFKAKLADQVFRDRNSMRITDYGRMQMSPAWLEKPKMDKDIGISHKDYQVRIDKVLAKAEKLWQKVQFGTKPGMVNPKGFSRTPAQIQNHLMIVLGKYKNKEAWLGTPPKTQPEQLHLFYSAQLADLEQIIAYLESENDPEKIVSYFERLTLAEAERRCAAAYRSENAQILQSIPGRAPVKGVAKAVEKAIDKAMNIGLNAKLEGAALNFFIKYKLPHYPRGSRPQADVHDLAQMQFYAGLTPVPDPLFHKEDSQRLIGEMHKTWTLEAALEAFDGFDFNDPDELSAWFKNNMPADFESAELQRNELMVFEKNAKDEMLDKLKSDAGLITQTASELTEAFSLPSWAGLYYKEVPDLSQQFQNAEAIAKFDEILDRVASGEGELYELVNLFKEQGLVPSKDSDRNAFQAGLKQMIANRKLQNQIAQNFKIKDVAMIKKIMVVKGDFDKKIRDFAKEKKIDVFDPKSHGIPSRALEDARKANFLDICIDIETGKLKYFGKLFMLEKQGIIAKR